MQTKHAVMISLAVGVAAAAGAVAATKTIHLGRAAAARPAVSARVIAQRTQAIDRAEIALRKALRQKPPKLPPLPAKLPAGSPGGAPAASGQAQRVVYVRPAPIVKHVHRHGGEDDGGDGGGGFDD